MHELGDETSYVDPLYRVEYLCGLQTSSSKKITMQGRTVWQKFLKGLAVTFMKSRFGYGHNQWYMSDSIYLDWV